MIPQFQRYITKWGLTVRQTIDLDGDRMTSLLQALGSPERSVPIIHIGGTNGKGSTGAFIDELLRAHGETVALFTSPALIDVHDQLRLNGRLVREEELDRAFEELVAVDVTAELTEFELLTVIAFLVIRAWNPTYAIIEVGLGGRDDSTNVVSPEVAVLTSIALDHVAVLGSTTEQIASVKAGIIKPSRPVVVGTLDEGARRVVEEVARAQRAPSFFLGTDFTVETPLPETYLGEKTYTWSSRLLEGVHQASNAAVALAALEAIGYPLDASRVTAAIERTTYAYRFEQVREFVWLDGAHNEAAARALVASIEQKWPGHRIDVAIGMLARKDIRAVVDVLRPVVSNWYCVDFHNEEAARGSDVQALIGPSARVVTLDDMRAMIDAPRTTPLVMTGSLYLLAQL